MFPKVLLILLSTLIFFTGTVEKGVVEITNCFCVPHKEYEDQVDAELNYAMDLYELNRRVNAQENIVGWWATGNEVYTNEIYYF